MFTEILDVLKIHKLTKEQYERELEAGRIDAGALYLTPVDEMEDVVKMIPQDLTEEQKTQVRSNIGITTIIPKASIENNGQFLRVIDGVPVWSTVPRAEEATF